MTNMTQKTCAECDHLWSFKNGNTAFTKCVEKMMRGENVVWGKTHPACARFKKKSCSVELSIGGDL